MEVIPAVIGAISGVISLLGVMYLLLVRVARTDAKVQVLWEMFIEIGLKQLLPRGYISEASPLSQRGIDAIPQALRDSINASVRAGRLMGLRDPLASVIGRLDPEVLKQMAGNAQLPYSDFMALVVLYVQQKCEERGRSSRQTQAYCVKCRAKKEMKRPRAITMKNGRPAVQGRCPTCGTKMFRILKG